MQYQVKTTKVLHLELTQEEAEWLRELVRNPLPQDSADPAGESAKDTKMRKLFFEATNYFE